MQAPAPIKDALRPAYRHARRRAKVWTSEESIRLVVDSGQSPRAVSDLFAKMLLSESPIRSVLPRLDGSENGAPSAEVFESILRDIVWERMEIGVSRYRRN